MARDPFHRAWIGEEAALIYEALRAALLADNPHISEDAIQDELNYYAKSNVVRPHIDIDSRNVAIAGTIWLIQAIYESFRPYCLTILRSPTPGFITADSPASIFDRYELAGTAHLTEDQAFHDETEFPSDNRESCGVDN